MALDITVDDLGLLGATAKNVLKTAESFRSCCTNVGKEITETKLAWTGPEASKFMPIVDEFYAALRSLEVAIDAYAPELKEKTNNIKIFFGDDELIA